MGPLLNFPFFFTVGARSSTRNDFDLQIAMCEHNNGITANNTSIRFLMFDFGNITFTPYFTVSNWAGVLSKIYLVFLRLSGYTKSAALYRSCVMFPTNLAMRLARDCGIHKHLQTDFHLEEAIADFQRVASISEFEDAMTIIHAHVTKDPITDLQVGVLNRIFNFTKIELSGHIVDSITKVMTDSTMEQNRLIAAKLIHGIQNGEAGMADSKEVKKIIFELAGASD